MRVEVGVKVFQRSQGLPKESRSSKGVKVFQRSHDFFHSQCISVSLLMKDSMSCMSTQAEGIGVVKRQRNWGFGMLGFGFSVMMLFSDGSYIAL